MNHTDAFGQEYGPGDLVAFSTGGAGRSTRIHIAEVLDITPVKDEYSVNAEYEYPDGRAWQQDENGRRIPPPRTVYGVDVKVRTLATTYGVHGSRETKRPTVPKTRNLVKWSGFDPRTEPAE